MAADNHRVLPVIYELADRLHAEHGITIRNMRERDLHAEVRRFMEVYNAAWEHNWGFVPLTDAELEDFAKQLRPLLDEKWAYIAELDGTTVGAALTLPDLKREWRHTGTAAAFYTRVWDTVLEHGIRRAETGWILETNEPMNRAMEALGGDVVKRFRIYGKPL